LALDAPLPSTAADLTFTGRLEEQLDRASTSIYAIARLSLKAQDEVAPWLDLGMRLMVAGQSCCPSFQVVVGKDVIELPRAGGG
jgi:hypothetical protein